jgi:hypothetical protein
VQGFASGFLPTPPHDDAVASGSELASPLPPGDFHPQAIAHAGRTQGGAAARHRGPASAPRALRWDARAHARPQLGTLIKLAQTGSSQVQRGSLFLAPIVQLAVTASRALRRADPSCTRSRASGPTCHPRSCRSTIRALPHATEMAQPAVED